MKRQMKQIMLIILGLTVFVSSKVSALEKYSPRVDIEPKTIVIRGSDTVEVMLKDWMRDFSRYHPHVKFDIVAKGSSKAVKALMNGEADLGPMSRKMKRKEARAFRSKFGYRPVRVSVAVDALAVVVNKRNPINELSPEDLDALFSDTRKCGGRKTVDTWGDLEVKGALNKQAPQLIGRNSSSGTYGFFRKKALCRGEFKEGINTKPDNGEIIAAVKEDVSAIGYVGLGYVEAGVKVISLRSRYSDNYIAPVMDSSKVVSYPLSRHLYIYLNLGPNDTLDSATAEFFRYIYSAQGQAVVTKKGFMALADHAVTKSYKELKIFE